MPRTSDKRERLINAAKGLIYRQGYNQTSLADIARESNVPLGNVYYYFKTKDEIGEAVIALRKSELTARMEAWEKEYNLPQDRLYSFIEYTLAMKDTMKSYGCPVGSLCQELDKSRSELAKHADELMSIQQQWVEKQFDLMGKSSATARNLALIFTAVLQGNGVVTNAFDDVSVSENVLVFLKDWVTQNARPENTLISNNS